MTAHPTRTAPDVPPVLDACCGSRMFWFDKTDERAMFIDKRREKHTLLDSSSKHGSRTLIVDPDIQADFKALPFADGSFALVVFDPPHLVRNGKSGWLAKKYGKLEGDWKEELRLGFAECFRVLKHEGTLVFKWNEFEVPVSQILALTPERPLFGNRCGRSGKSHWVVFLKQAPDFRAGWEGTADECPVCVLPLDEDGRCPRCLKLPEETVKELRK